MNTPPRNPFPVRINRASSMAHSQIYAFEPKLDPNVPKQVDHYLESTYTGLINKKIQTLTAPELAPTNSLLINYIRHIYSKYSLEDPMRKYGDQRFWGTADTRDHSGQQTSPSGPIDSRRKSVGISLSSRLSHEGVH